MDENYPNPLDYDEMIAWGYTIDASGRWVEIGEPCSVDGRPTQPEDLFFSILD